MPFYLQASTADSAASTCPHPLSSHHHDQQPYLCGAARWEVDHYRGEKSFRDSMKRLETSTVQLNWIDVLKLHAIKPQQFIYSLRYKFDNN